jgi:hypothetical protein
MPAAGRFAMRSQVELLLPRVAQGATITLTYAQPTTTGYHYQNHSLGQHTGSVHTLTLPGTDSGEPTPRLTLTFESAPIDRGALVTTATPIGSTGISLDPGVTILAQSAGEEVGDFAHLWINGVDYGGGERGYHLVALMPTGEVLGTATFDTMQSEETTRMADWLAQWPAGTVIAGAGADSVAGEDAGAWDERGSDALLQLGVAGDLRGKLRWSHAFVGVSGAPPQCAIEDVQAYYPAAVWLGAPLSAPAVYATLQSVTLEAN